MTNFNIHLQFLVQHFKAWNGEVIRAKKHNTPRRFV